MTNFSLFDPPIQPPATSPPHVEPSQPAPPVIHSDVLRIIRPKPGKTFRAIRVMTEAEREDSKVDYRSLHAGEFVIVELRDGRFMWQFEDGHREPATKATTRTLIADAVRDGLFVEEVCG